MLFAIGAGGQVKAVDDQSTYPSQAPRTSLSGFKPNAEAIAAQKPDLVVLSNDPGGIAKTLGALKVPVLPLDAPKTLDGAYAQEELLGRATGHAAEAKQVADTTRDRIAKAAASVPSSGKTLKVYHELDPTYYSVTSDTFIGDLYKTFGLQNIADASPKAAGGYPQLSAEYVVSAAPDLIVLADGKCCGQSPATVAKRPAFAAVPAVMSGRVVDVDDDIASRWGPRVADFAERIAKSLTANA
jgi:iron complex transport system substrate-binding protein